MRWWMILICIIDIQSLIRQIVLTWRFSSRRWGCRPRPRWRRRPTRGRCWPRGRCQGSACSGRTSQRLPSGHILCEKKPFFWQKFLPFLSSDNINEHEHTLNGKELDCTTRCRHIEITSDLVFRQYCQKIPPTFSAASTTSIQVASGPSFSLVSARLLFRISQAWFKW